MNLLKHLREKNGFSQDHLAMASGVGKRTVQRVEAGECHPSPETAMALAQNLGTEPDAILNWCGLRLKLRECVRAWSDRSATTEELKRLPPGLRPVFHSYYCWRASVQKCDDDLSRVMQEIETRMAASAAERAREDANGELWPKEDILGYIALRQSALARAATQSAKMQPLLDRQRMLMRRLFRVHAEAAVAATALDRELDEYDVFAPHRLPRALVDPECGLSA